MKQKALIITRSILGILFCLSLNLSTYDIGAGEILISTDLADYKNYLEYSSPLDRLYIYNNKIFLLVNHEELNSIKDFGIVFTIEHFPVQATRAMTGTGGDINGPYHTYLETADFLKGLAGSFPNLASVGSAGYSLEGRSLYYIKISAGDTGTTEKPNVYILGCHHAREWISVEVPLLFAQYLLTNYGTDPEVTRAVDGANIYIMPLVNPDGLEYSIHYYRLWRKNRKYNGYNAYGVDINRNYGFMWGYDNIGSSSDIWSEVYRGASAFSEPETQAVGNLLLSHPPAGLISYHNYSQVILFPWNYKDEPTTEDDNFNTLASNMSQLIYQVNGRVYEYGRGASALYTTNGDTIDYTYGTFKTPAFTIELPPVEWIDGGFYTSEEMIQSVFSENLPALLYFVNYFITE